MPTESPHIKPSALNTLLASKGSWAIDESLCWSDEIAELIEGPEGDRLFAAAYDSVDWPSYYERLRGTPFYDWAVEGGGMLSFSGHSLKRRPTFSSHYGDMSTAEGDWLRDHPEFNQLLHDLHVEAVNQMIDFILEHADEARLP